MWKMWRNRQLNEIWICFFRRDSHMKPIFMFKVSIHWSGYVVGENDHYIRKKNIKIYVMLWPFKLHYKWLLGYLQGDKSLLFNIYDFIRFERYYKWWLMYLQGELTADGVMLLEKKSSLNQKKILVLKYLWSYIILRSYKWR